MGFQTRKRTLVKTKESAESVIRQAYDPSSFPWCSQLLTSPLKTRETTNVSLQKKKLSLLTLKGRPLRGSICYLVNRLWSRINKVGHLLELRLDMLTKEYWHWKGIGLYDGGTGLPLSTPVHPHFYWGY